MIHVPPTFPTKLKHINYYTLHTLLYHWYSYQGLHQCVHKFCGGQVSSMECDAEVAADCEGCGHGTQINLVGNL